MDGKEQKIFLRNVALLFISSESKRQRSHLASTYQDAKVRSDWMVFRISREITKVNNLMIQQSSQLKIETRVVD